MDLSTSGTAIANNNIHVIHQSDEQHFFENGIRRLFRKLDLRLLPFLVLLKIGSVLNRASMGAHILLFNYGLVMITF